MTAERERLGDRENGKARSKFLHFPSTLDGGKFRKDYPIRKSLFNRSLVCYLFKMTH